MINTTLVANTIQPKYSKKLLEKAVQQTRLLEFAKREALPAQAGATSIRFFRPEAANLGASGAPAALTEGTAPATYRTITYTPIDVALSQRGQVTRVSDIATNIGLIQYLDGAIDLMGEECALDAEIIVRNQLAHQTTGLGKRYAQGLANFTALAGASASAGCLTPRDLLDALTQLKINRAPTIGGKYVLYAPPQHTRDIMNNAEFREVVRQNYADKIFKGEIGEYYNCKIVEGTVPFQEDETEGTYASSFVATGTNTTGFIYSAFVLGAGAFGAVDLPKAGSSPDKKPSVIINDKPDKTDPLGQWITAGWKAYWGSAVLNPNFGIALRAKSQFA
ncbi:N4-gp56 family major capsid protein [Nibricoccus sp. IMCC34717]|uniref:N4-gp56 family major capsid protein n=1 Tax=Nibricoccus sp. IMCC34717 TaxID=3034021 RepID=UPI00384BAD1C